MPVGFAIKKRLFSTNASLLIKLSAQLLRTLSFFIFYFSKCPIPNLAAKAIGIAQQTLILFMHIKHRSYFSWPLPYL